MRKKGGRRAIAVFLLAFAFFDIAIIDMISPQLCGDDQFSPTFAGAIESGEDPAEESTAAAAGDSESSQDSHSRPIDMSVTWARSSPAGQSDRTR